MTLKDLLAENKNLILQRWFDRLLEDYPPEARGFLRENKSPYSNPIGFTLRKGMEGVLAVVLEPGSGGAVRAILEPVMKVRAVENLSLPQGGKFILPLREVIAEVVKEAAREEDSGQERLDLNSRITHLALLAMNLYSECRERVNRLRIEERERRGGRVADRRTGA